MVAKNEYAYKISISYESGDRLTRDAGNKHYGQGRSNTKSKNQGAFCNISVGFDDLKELQEKAKIFDSQQFIDTVEVIRETAKSVVKFSLGDIDVEVAMPPPYYEETEPTAEQQASPTNDPPITQQQPLPQGDVPVSHSTTYPSVEDYLTARDFAKSDKNPKQPAYFRSIYENRKKVANWNVFWDSNKQKWCVDTYIHAEGKAFPYNPMAAPPELREIHDTVQAIHQKVGIGGGLSAY